MKLRPASPSLVIRDPFTKRALPADGDVFALPLSTFWQRRLDRGDVVEVPEEEAPLPAPSPEEP